MNHGQHGESLHSAATLANGNASDRHADPREESPSEEEDFVLADEAWVEDQPDVERFAWLGPLSATLAVLAWTVFFIVANGPATTQAPPAEWSSLVADWAMPVALIVLLWLLAMRNSRRESARFAHAARALAAESASLEARLTNVNRELSLARDFIAAQSRDLESLGRVAADRLSTHADRLQDLIRDNGQQVETIGRVSETTLGNMETLRDQLPVISNATRDLANQIGNTGNVATSRIEDLTRGFEQMGVAAEQSGGRLDGLHARVTQTLEAIDAQAVALEGAARERFAELRRMSEDFAVELDAREADGFAAIRRRAALLHDELSAEDISMLNRAGEALGDMRVRVRELRAEGLELAGTLQREQREAQERWAGAIAGFEDNMRQAIARVSETDEAAMASARERLAALGAEAERVDHSTAASLQAFADAVGRHRDDAMAHHHAALADLEDRLADFDRRMAQRRDEDRAHAESVADRAEALAGRFVEIDRCLADLSSQGDETSERLGGAADQLAARLGTSRSLMVEGGQALAQLTERSERLLDLVISSTAQSAEELPRALDAAEERLGTVQARADALHSTVGQAEEKGASLAGHVDYAQDKTTGSLDTVDALAARLAELTTRSDMLADRTRDQLADSVAGLEAASETFLARMREGQDAAMRDFSATFGEKSREVMEDTIRANTASALLDLERAALKAGEAGRETIAQLREQIASVDEIAASLEARLADAQGRAQDLAENDFPRLMAEITDDLHSGAIDIAQVFEAEYPEQSWESYLRGDRGIFTRRVVKLLNAQQAREIRKLYEEEDALRARVDRYVHDFEKMLRAVLGTQQGQSVAVTLVSSDIGKLYVALAQAIERLRG